MRTRSKRGRIAEGESTAYSSCSEREYFTVRFRPTPAAFARRVAAAFVPLPILRLRRGRLVRFDSLGNGFFAAFFVARLPRPVPSVIFKRWERRVPFTFETTLLREDLDNGTRRTRGGFLGRDRPRGFGDRFGDFWRETEAARTRTVFGA